MRQNYTNSTLGIIIALPGRAAICHYSSVFYLFVVCDYCRRSDACRSFTRAGQTDIRRGCALDNCMETQNAASTEPIYSTAYTDDVRYIAMAVTSSSLGLGVGNPMWLVIGADKRTGEISCAIRSTLPDIFIPR